MKALILVCGLVATSVAAPTSKRPTKLDPKLAPQVQTAEQAWGAAEAADAAKQPDLWERAALAFDAVDGAQVDAKTKRDAAYAAVLAWKNSLPPEPPQASGDGKPERKLLSARAQHLVAATARYLAYASPTDADVPGVLFVEANTYQRFGQLDIAIVKSRAIVERYPRADVAEYAANLVLDSYNRLEQYDQLVAFAEQLAKDAAFLSGRNDLARTVEMILRRGERWRAEQLERAAKETKDWDTYVAAAEAYLAIYNADPKSRENDEVLYNAGVAYEEGRSIAKAIEIYLLLAKRYPNSKLSMRAMARLARAYGDIAMYDKAAAQLEEYAKRYAGEKDAHDAMSDAVYFRKALGDRAKVIEDTQYFIKTFGAKRVAEAADASWSLTAVYEPDPDATIKHLREYLRMFGGKGDAGRVVIAHAKIGAALWKQSCPHALVDGLCVKVTTRAPRTCGQGTTSTMIATRRDAAKSKAALAELALATKEFERRAGHFDDPAARYFYAQARLVEADVALEAYLADSRPASQELGAWLDQKHAARTAMTIKYDTIVTIKDPATAITAVERNAMVAQSLASQLVTGPRPRDAAQCDAAIKAAAPLEADAVTGFVSCLSMSAKLQWFDASSAHCAQQLVELAPDEFPPARERYSQPSFAAPVLALEPPIR